MKQKLWVMMLIPFAAFSVQADIVETVEDCEFVYSGSAQSPLLVENVLTLPFTFSWGGHSYHEVDLSEWGCLNFSDGYIWVADRVDMSAVDAGMFISNDTHSVTIRWTGKNCFGESTILNAAITLYDDGHFVYTYGANDSVLGQGFDFQNDGYAWFGSSLYDTITNNKRITITDDGKPTPFKNENEVVWADVKGYFYDSFGVKNSRYTSYNGDTIHIATGSEKGGVCLLTVKGSGTLSFKARGSSDGFFYGFNNDNSGQGGYVRNNTDYKSYSMTITADANELHTVMWVTYAGSHLGGGWGDVKEVTWNDEPITYVAANGCGTIPETWSQNFPTFEDKFGNVFLGALMQKTGKKDASGNPMRVWQDYLAGTDPTDESSRFTAHIVVSNGNPIVSWRPNLNTNGEVRAYKVWGTESLEDLNWEFPTNSLHRFFKVSVEMLTEQKDTRVLPDGYTANDVSCVSCTGSEWYDLGLPPTLTMKTQIKCSFEGENEHMGIIGVLPASNNDVNDYRLFIAAEPYQFFVDFPGSARIKGGSAALNTVYEMEFGNFYLKDLSNGTTILQGDTVTKSPTSDHIRLFRTNYAYPDRYTIGSVYYVKIFDKDVNDEYVLVRDLMPCKNPSGEVGLYDFVGRRFYAKDGSSVAVSE